MAKRERFFEFNARFALGLLAVVVSAWLTYGPVFVLVVGVVTGVVIGVYYFIWTWLHRRTP